MSFRWRCYVSFAEAIVAAPPRCETNDCAEEEAVQASYRAALSRAYYGVFGCTLDYLRDVEQDFNLNLPLRQQNGQTFTPAEIKQAESDMKEIHRYVLSCLMTELSDKNRDNLRTSLHKVLTELRSRRREADYEAPHAYGKGTVKLAINSAKDALRYIAQLGGSI